MARINVKPPTFKARLLVGLGVVLSVGAVLIVGWGIGWMAHRVFSAYGEPTPTEMVWPTATSSVIAPTGPVSTGVPTDTPSEPTAVQPTTTPMMTSTPLPTITPTVTEEVVDEETVQAGEGLYQVCRRHCPGRWPESGVPSDLEGYAREIAQENQLEWGAHGPSLKAGQRLRMLPCP